MKMMNIKKLEQGRSMIEMLGVLAIIGVLSVGGINGFSKAMDAHKINTIVEQIGTIIANAKSIGLRQGGKSTGLDTSDEMIDSSGKVTHVYGGEVRVGSAKELYGSTPTDKGVVVELKSLSRNACIQILSKGLGGPKTILVASGSNSPNSSSKISGYTQYSSAAKCETPSNDYAICYNQDMPLSTIANACSCGANNTCAIAVWAFRTENAKKYRQIDNNLLTK